MSDRTTFKKLPLRIAEPKPLSDTSTSELGVIMLDSQGRITGMTPAVGAMLCVDSHAFVHRSLAEFLEQICASTETERILEAVQQALTAGRSSGFEVQLLGEEMPAVYAKILVSPIRGGGVSVVGAVLTLEDITPYKEVGLTPLADENARLYTEALEHVIRLEKLKERYRWESIHDGLTNVYNHRHFQTLLKLEVARAQRYNHPLALLMIDIDDFKAYNDAYGHTAGNEALRDIALILQYARRQTDLLARFGGEEFALILPETDIEGALALAERLRLAVEQESRRGMAFRRPVTISIGVSVSPPDHPQKLVMLADERLYQAKEAGKNRVFGLEPDEATAGPE